MNKKLTFLALILAFISIIFSGCSYVGNGENLGATILAVKQGGTGATSFTAGECLIGAGTGAITTGTCGTGGGGSSPLTDKGDIFTYSSTSTRLAVGTNGQVLMASSTTVTGLAWQATSTLGITGGGGSGTVTSVDMSVPTGLSISGNPITTSGTLAVTLTAGYIIPLSASTTNWNTAYNWGNHATAGYLLQSYASSTYGTISYIGGLSASASSTFVSLAYVNGLSASATSSMMSYVGGLSSSATSSFATPAYVQGLSSSATSSMMAYVSGLSASASSTFITASSSNLSLSGNEWITGTLNVTGKATFGLASTTAVSATTFYGALTGTASGNLVSGGTLTSAYHCRYDGAGIDCDRVEDASGACGANAVCMGGHTHVGADETYASGWAGDTSTPEKDDVYDYLHLIDTDDDGLANNLDTDAVDAITEIAAALKDGSGDCSTGLICLGDHTHSTYAALASPTFTGVVTMTNASSTNITVSGTSYLATIAQTATNTLSALGVIDATSGKLIIPVGASPTVTVAGQVAVDTTSDQFAYYGGAKRIMSYIQDASFTIASSTWMSNLGTATNTIPLGAAPYAESWNNAYCYTDTGTAWFNITDGTNDTNAFQASTTAGYLTFSSNQTFTAGEKRYLEIGSFASTPNFVSCVIIKTITSD